MSGGRRIADTGAWLFDRVFPEVRIRQWVLTLPFALRNHLAFDAEFMRAVLSSLRRCARHECGILKPRCGAATFVQRFRDALNLNIHFHGVVLDGVYEDRGADPLAEEES